MSKLKKLMSVPGLFSRYFKKKVQAKRALQDDSDVELLLDDDLQTRLKDGCQNSQYFREAFIELLLRKFAAVDMQKSPEGFTQIGLLREDKINLIKLFSNLHDTFDIQLWFRNPGRFLDINQILTFGNLKPLTSIASWIIDFRIWLRKPGKFLNLSRLSSFGKYKLLNNKSSWIIDFRPTGSLEGDIQADDPAKQIVCLVFWKDMGEFYETSLRNKVARRISKNVAEQHGMFQIGEQKSILDLHPCPPDSLCQFPVDIVYTWVNSEDTNWQKMYKQHLAQKTNCSADSISLDRFYNRDELKYSLRSIERYAPWVRKVFIISNCAPPEWLNLDLPEVEFVDHSVIFSPEELPTFNSHAIESRLHHIPDLSEHFIYFNDDIFLGRPTVKEDFFSSTGMSYSTLENYGMVHGDPNPDEPDYFNAARNGKRLIEETFGQSPTMLHTHSPYCLRRSVIEEMEEKYSLQFSQTANTTFRTVNDISVPSFFYHHYAYHIGKAQRRKEETGLFKISNKHIAKKVHNLKNQEYLSFCINDGDSSANSKQWGRLVINILESVFSLKSKFENR